MNKLLIVEDIEALRSHLIGVIGESLIGAPHVVQAANGVEGLRLFQTERPQMVIMDAVMSEISGLKAAKFMWKQNPQTRILFWCQTHRDAYLRELQRIAPREAVFGYALKAESKDKLKHALLSVFLHSNPYIDPKVRSFKGRPAFGEHQLTEGEFETLVDVMLGLTDRAIASRRSISVRGVQNRLASLLNKLMQKEHWALQKTAGMEIYNPRTRVIYEALKRGYITIEELLQFEEDLNDWLSTSINYRKGTIVATADFAGPAVDSVAIRA